MRETATRTGKSGTRGTGSDPQRKRGQPTPLPASLICLFLVFVWLIPLFAAGGRVVAIGDVHGDLDAFIGILRRAKLIDASRQWTGGAATLVQTGDFLDRGPKARDVMDVLMDLQKQGARQGGRVIVLMGNHEAMNIYGDLRYVSETDYASFGGRTERCKAFGPGGPYGKWLRALPAVAQIDDSIFLHGGIDPQLASWKIAKINDSIAAEIRAFDAYRKYLTEEKKLAPECATLDELTDAAKAAQSKAKDKDADILNGFLSYPGWLSVHPAGPLWFRGYAQWSDADGAPQIRQLAQAFGVARFVVGHTPQSGQITRRFDGKVYLIDTGMLSSYFAGGRASALNIQDGKVSMIY